MQSSFSPRDISVSFEFFPPKTEEMEARLWESISLLGPLEPGFVSVTYGAGGSTRERTHATVKRIVEETSLNPAAHLTCVAAPKEEILEVAKQYWQAGVRHIVALRGDQPGGGAYTPHPQGYCYANDLIEGVRGIGEFEISVAAFPEKHPESESFAKDFDVLKRKIDAGATRAITQYFFDVELYFRYVEAARKAGIDIPIVPGILPITNFKQTVKFSDMCGATVPNWMGELFDGLDDNPTTRSHVATHLAVEQCRRLQDFGVRHFHFYTLNRAELVLAICHVLGIRDSQRKSATS